MPGKGTGQGWPSPERGTGGQSPGTTRTSAVWLIRRSSLWMEPAFLAASRAQKSMRCHCCHQSWRVPLGLSHAERERLPLRSPQILVELTKLPGIAAPVSGAASPVSGAASPPAEATREGPVPPLQALRGAMVSSDHPAVSPCPSHARGLRRWPGAAGSPVSPRRARRGARCLPWASSSPKAPPASAHQPLHK